MMRELRVLENQDYKDNNMIFFDMIFNDGIMTINFA